MYNRPINYNIQWSSAGNPSPPTQEKMRNGWNGNEKPLVEHMNWILNRIDGAIGYFLQGTTWGSEVYYPKDALVNHNGVIYRAKDVNTNKAVTDTNFWEVAFYSTLNGESLAEEIDKIKNQDGYLSKYLKISDPVTTARMKAGSFQADVGLGVTNSFNMGYSFKGYETTGMYLNGTTLYFRIGGVTKATIANASPELTDRTTSIATTDWVQRLIDDKIGSIDMTANRLGIGTVFLTISEQNPKDILGYGTWVRFSEGRVLVGKSTQVADPSWMKTTLNVFGEEKHTLTIGETPAHTHETGMIGYAGFAPEAWRAYGGSDGISSDGIGDPLGYRTSLPTGGGEAHNNIQPSIVVNIWRRTA